MIRNASMLKMETFAILDEQLQDDPQQKEALSLFVRSSFPAGELKVEETKRRFRALRGGEVQRTEDLVLTDKCGDCDGSGLVERPYGFGICDRCNGTGRILKKRESMLGRAAAICLTLALLVIGAWWALARWGVL